MVGPEQPTLEEVFDRRLTYPDMEAHKRLERLVGIDEARARLTKLLSISINPTGLRDWICKHHKDAKLVVDYLERRPPLVVLAGDVGTGKTELAETIGNAVARQEGINVTLYPVSLATRGSGKVGEMTKLLSAVFELALQEAKKLKSGEDKATGGMILLVDEADALAQTREAGQMHHEDRAGVNAFIRGIDRFAERRLPVAVVLCTNRISAIDPAVQRRAAEIFEFNRPNDIQRRSVIAGPLSELGFNESQIDQIVQLTGVLGNCEYGYTFSDLTQRLIPTLVLDAYPDKPVTFDRALEIVDSIRPTPPFRDGGGE